MTNGKDEYNDDGEIASKPEVNFNEIYENLEIIITKFTKHPKKLEDILKKPKYWVPIWTVLRREAKTQLENVRRKLVKA